MRMALMMEIWEMMEVVKNSRWFEGFGSRGASLGSNCLVASITFICF
jgi:hypothetical protein